MGQLVRRYAEVGKFYELYEDDAEVGRLYKLNLVYPGA
jgi:hypothetical protein